MPPNDDKKTRLRFSGGRARLGQRGRSGVQHGVNPYRATSSGKMPPLPVFRAMLHARSLFPTFLNP
jgi:hypothetical protein